MLLRTLGGLELEEANFRRPKPLLLLAYLALEGPQERGHLAELFFRGSKKARANLSVALSRLRQVAPDVLESDNDRVWSELETDVGCLMTALERGAFDEVVEAYRGRFLNGIDTSDLGPELEEWVYKTRERIATHVRRALLTLAEQVAVPGQFGEAASYAEQAYLLSGAPEPDPQDLTRLYTLFAAAEHSRAAEVRAEAQAYGLTLTLEPEAAQEQLLETRPADWLPANPYKGLAYFREEDAELFFGREVACEALVREVRRRPLVTLIGSSGSGKSSLVFAGLVPILRKEGWLVAGFRPGLQPFGALAAALLETLEPHLGEIERLREAKQLAALLREGELTLSDLLERLRQRHPERELLLTIDQFEELYTFSETHDPERGVKQQTFLGSLLAAVQTHGNFCKTVLTLRADFLAAVLGYRPMVDLLQGSEYLLGPMNEAELRAVIEKPALKRNVALEEGLVNRILHDVTGREGSLPLLEFALSQLWAHQAHGRLTHDAYDAIGGLERALANHAEATFLSLSDRERTDAQRVFLQLVHPGAGQEDTRRVATHQDVGDTWTLISKLASARLVVTGQNEAGEQTAEVIHEALIRHWGRLRRWVDTHRSFRRWQEHLRQDVRRWQEQRDEGFLLRGFPLEEARQHLQDNGDKLTEVEKAFIEASLALEAREQAERERRRRERARLQRRITQVLSTALLVALALTGVAAWQWRTANRRSEQLAEREGALEVALSDTETQRALAEQERDAAEQQRLLATFRGLEGQALAAVQNDAYGLAHLLTAQGLKMTKDDPDNLKNFLSVMLAMPQNLKASLEGHVGTLGGLAFSPDGTRLASISIGDKLILWDLATLRAIGELPVGGEGVAFSPDGKRLASSDGEGTVTLWDAETLTRVGEPLLGHMANTPTVVFSPDGKLLASGDDDRVIILWDVESHMVIGEPLVSDTGASDINEIAFSPDGKLLASAELCCDVVVWDVATGEQIGRLRGHQDSVDSVTFSPDSTLLASSGWDETIILWDVETQRMIGEPFSNHSDAVMGLAFTPDGKTLISGSYDKTITFWDVATRKPIGEPLRGHETAIRSLRLSADGTTIASGAVDGTVLLWDLSNTQQVGDPLDSHYVGEIAVSPDGKTFASGSWDGTIMLWDAQTRERLETVASEDGYVNTLAYSPDGEMLLSNSLSPKSVRFWDAETLQPIGEPLTWPNDEDVFPWSVAFSPDGTSFATGSWGTEGIIVWDTSTLTPVGEPLVGHTGRISSLAYSPDGKLIASASHDRTIRLWDAATYKLIAVLEGHADSVNNLAFSPDGKFIASAGEDELVILWDVEKGTAAGPPLDAHTSIVYWVAFSPDGNMLASASEKDGIMVWDVATRQPLAFPYRGHTDNDVSSVAFSPDGQYLVSGGAEVMLWEPKPAPVNWLERACRLAGRNLTQEEWQIYLGDLPYEATCPEFPPG